MTGAGKLLESTAHMFYESKVQTFQSLDTQYRPFLPDLSS